MILIMETKKIISNPPIELKKTVFIFGISSFVGSNLAEFLKQHYRVIGAYNDHPVKITGVLTFPLDIINRDAIRLAMFTFKPDIVIYAIGLSSLNACDYNQALATDLNATGLSHVAHFADHYESKLFYISTCYVFSGEKVTYLEADTPLANSIYGKSKGAGEFFLYEKGLNYIVLRCCTLYGRSLLSGQTTWFEALQKKLFTGNSIGMDNSVQGGFLDIVYLAIIIKICIEKNISNKLFQVCSKDIMTHYEFALRYATAFNDRKDLINRTTWNFPQLRSSIIPLIESQDLKYHMDVESLEGFFNIELPTVDESLELTKYRFGQSHQASPPPTKANGVTFI